MENAEVSSPSPSTGSESVQSNEQVVSNTGSPAEINSSENVVNPETGMTKAEEDQFELKINGNTTKYKKSDVISAAQRFYAGEDKLREATNMQQAVVQALKERPWEVLEKLGLDPDEIAHQRLYEKIRLSKLTPEQKELEELRNKSKTWEEREQEQVKLQQEQEKQTVVQQHQNETAKSILEELPKATDFPQTSDSVIKIIGKLKEALTLGQPITVPQAIESLRQDRIAIAKWMATQDPAQLQEMLGQETVGKLSKHQIDQLKVSASQNRATGNKKTVPNKPAEKAPRISQTEWLEQRRIERYGS